jgi:oxygen-independent coproporphyrinogen-3 oxidase
MAGLYIHIPFCGSRCAYCDFYSTVGAGRIPEFLEALKREMTARGGLPAFGSPLSTIYVGGGTPSLLSPSQLRGVLDHAVGLWDCSGLVEVTVEANPEDLTPDRLAGLVGLAGGVSPNRLSIGIQSFDDDLLRLMNRRHTAERARRAVRAAQEAGFDNISIDLIYGIPGMSHAQWERSLDEAIALGVQHISAYHLTIEPGTPFGKMAKRDEGNRSPSAFRPIPEAESERQFATLRRKLLGAGFEHYEISNFALPGRRAMHNSAYWSGAAYLGVGPSAHSFDGVRRREWVAGDVGRYIAGRVEYGGETLSDRDLYNERIMTGLRTAAGVEAAAIRPGAALERFLREGLLIRNGDRVAIPPEKFLLSDYLIATLFENGES